MNQTTQEQTINVSTGEQIEMAGVNPSITMVTPHDSVVTPSDTYMDLDDIYDITWSDENNNNMTEPMGDGDVQPEDELYERLRNPGEYEMLRPPGGTVGEGAQYCTAGVAYARNSGWSYYINTKDNKPS